MSTKISVNRLAFQVLKRMLENPNFYNVKIEETASGATLLDCGIKAKGGFEAGKAITEICLGGCGKAEIIIEHYGRLSLPTILVYTDHPAIATLGSQFAGWQIKAQGYFAIGSGPARALALEPKEIYEKIAYSDQSEKGIVVLETSSYPPEMVIQKIADECKIQTENLYFVLVPTESLAGSIQVSGRIVETGIHKLVKLGLNPNVFASAWGYAPIMSVHPKFVKAMGRTNDAILYGGVAYYTVAGVDDEELRQAIAKAVSKTSERYGKTFFEIFKEANYDFYKIDPNLFAPAEIIINNTETGNTFKAGEINPEILAQSLKIQFKMK